jgi:hypothetical protein
MPRWRGLNHFMVCLSVEFTDGSKWEDFSKVCYRKSVDNCVTDKSFDRVRYVSQFCEMRSAETRTVFACYAASGHTLNWISWCHLTHIRIKQLSMGDPWYKNSQSGQTYIINPTLKYSAITNTSILRNIERGVGTSPRCI